MLRPELSWIILLTAVCCSAYDGEIEKSVSCEGITNNISCGKGIIEISYANYGRVNSGTCSSGRPPQQLNNTRCFLSQTLLIMSDRCNGKTQCSVSATNAVFSDPCYGTYKYLEVFYTCIPAKGSFTCEGSLSNLGCGKDTDVIQIYYANYGRRDSTTCSSGRPPEQLTNTNCYQNNTQMMSNRCDGKNQCSVSVSNAVFSDPCYGTYKYLEVVYDCFSTCKCHSFTFLSFSVQMIWSL